MPVGLSPEAVRAQAAFRQTETKRRQTELEADRLALAQRDFALREAGQRLEQTARQQVLQRQQTRQQLVGQLATEFAPGAFAPRAPGAAVGAAPGAVPQQAPGGAVPNIQQLAAEAGLTVPGAAPADGPGFGIAPGIAAEALPIIGQLVGAGATPEQVAGFLQILAQARAPAPPSPEDIEARKRGAATELFAPGGVLPRGVGPPRQVPPQQIPPGLEQFGVVVPRPGPTLEQVAEERGVPSAAGAILAEIGRGAFGLAETGVEAFGISAAGEERLRAIRAARGAQKQATKLQTQLERERIERALKDPADRQVASTILEVTRSAGPVSQLIPGPEVLQDALARSAEILRALPADRRERVLQAIEAIRPDLGQALRSEIAPAGAVTAKAGAGEAEQRTQSGFDILLDVLGNIGG